MILSDVQPTLVTFTVLINASVSVVANAIPKMGAELKWNVAIVITLMLTQNAHFEYHHKNTCARFRLYHNTNTKH